MKKGGYAAFLLLMLLTSPAWGIDLNQGLGAVTETTTSLSKNAIIAIVSAAILGLFASFVFGAWKGYAKAKREQDVDNPITAAGLEGIKYAGFTFVAEFLIGFGAEKLTNVNLFQKVIEELFK